MASVSGHAGVSHHPARSAVRIGQLVNLCWREWRRGVGRIDVNRHVGVTYSSGCAWMFGAGPTEIQAFRARRKPAFGKGIGGVQGERSDQQAAVTIADGGKLMTQRHTNIEPATTPERLSGTVTIGGPVMDSVREPLKFATLAVVELMVKLPVKMVS